MTPLYHTLTTPRGVNITQINIPFRLLFARTCLSSSYLKSTFTFVASTQEYVSDFSS